MDLTGLFLQFQRCEVLIYLPLPFVARFLSLPDQERALTALFGTDRWKEAKPLSWNERLAFLHDLFRDQLRDSGCTYVRSFEIQSGGARGYHLFFGTTVACHREGTALLPHTWDHLGGHRAGRVDMMGGSCGGVKGGPRAQAEGIVDGPEGKVSEVMGEAFRAL